MASYLVTGASKGIGYAFVKKFSQNPANTVIGIVRDKAATEKKLEDDGIKNVLLYQADICDFSALQAAAKDLQTKLKSGIDYLIANAGYVSMVSALKTLADFDGTQHETLEEDLSKSFQVNVVGFINTVNAFIPLVQKGAVKKVVAISSGTANLDLVNQMDWSINGPYAISKAGLNMAIAKYNAIYKKDGILFVAICPGAVDTDAFAGNAKIEWSAAEIENLQGLGAKFQTYAPDFKGHATPDESVRDVMNVVDGASLEKGDGGMFTSHFGTTERWL